MNRAMKGFLSLIVLLAAQAAFAQVGVQTGQITVIEGPEGAAPTVRVAAEPTQEGSNDCATAQPITPGALPLRGKNSLTGLCFWNQRGQEYLKYARFVSSSKTFSASTELVTDVFGTKRLGPIRVSFSGAVAAPTTGEDDDTTTTAAAAGDDEPTTDEDKTLNLFKTNGGNLALTASYPLYYTPIGNGQFLWNSYLRVAGNIDAMGGDTNEVTTEEDDINGNVEIAFSELQLDLLSFQEKFNLLGYVKASGVVGSKKFTEALGDDINRSFIHGQIGAGIRISTKMTIYFNYNWYSDDDIPGNGGAFTIVMGD